MAATRHRSTARRFVSSVLPGMSMRLGAGVRAVRARPDGGQSGFEGWDDPARNALARQLVSIRCRLSWTPLEPDSALAARHTIAAVPAILAAGLAGLLLLASVAGDLVLVGAVVLAQVVLLVGLTRTVPVPAAQRAAGLALTAGVVAAVAVALDDSAPNLGIVAPVLGVGLLGALLLELARRHDRSELTASLTYTVTALVLAVLVVSWVVLRTAPGGGTSVAVGLVGVAVVDLAEGLPGPRPMWRLVAIIAAAGAGVALTTIETVNDAAPPVSVMVIATFTALLAVAAAAIVDRVELELAEERATTGPAPVTGGRRRRARRSSIDGPLALRAALPVTLAAPVAYVLGRILVG